MIYFSLQYEAGWSDSQKLSLRNSLSFHQCDHAISESFGPSYVDNGKCIQETYLRLGLNTACINSIHMYTDLPPFLTGDITL